jgi:hypothetical protein
VYSGRLYTSSNGGVDWTERQPAGDIDNYWRAAASDADGSNLIVAAGGRRLYTSSNGGVDWTERQPAGDVDRDWNVVASDADGSNLLVVDTFADAYIGSGRVYTSSDSGANWTERQPAGDVGKAWNIAASDADGSNLIVGAGGSGRIYTSSNGGVDWTERQPAGDVGVYWGAGTSDASGSNLFVYGNDGGSPRFFSSEDSGETWLEENPGGNRQVSASFAASDADGTHIAFASYGAFFLAPDNTGPFVLSFDPTDEATEVAVDGTFSITFNEDIATSTGSIELYKTSDDSLIETIDVAGPKVTVSGTDLTIDPTTILDVATGYYVLIDAGAIEDLVGNAFAGISDPTAWSFTTDTAPVVVSFSPANDAENIAIEFLAEENVTIEFNQSMVVGSGNITLKKVSDDSTVETFDVTDGDAVEAGGSTVYLYPETGALEYGTEYYFTIDAGALEDENGNAYGGIADETTWNFTTQAAPPPDAVLDELKNRVSFDGPINAVVTDGTTLYVGGNFDFAVGGGTTGGGIPFDETTQAAVSTFPEVEGQVSVVVSDGDGGWYIGGTFTSVGGTDRNNIAHITSLGTVDEGFDPNVNATVESLVLSSDGSILYAGGGFSYVNNEEVSRGGVAAFDTETGVATDFDIPDPDGAVRALVLSPDDTILFISGSISNVGAYPRRRVAAFDTDTSEVLDFDPAPNSSAGVALAYDDGVVYMGGPNMTSVNNYTYAQEFIFDTTAEQKSLLPTVNGGNPAVAVSDGDGGWYVGGNFTNLTAQNTARNRLAHILADGTVDPNFDPDLDSSVISLALSSDGEILYAGGYFSTVNGGATTRNKVAAFYTETGVATDFDPNIEGGANAIALSPDDGTLYVTGNFQTVNGATTRHGAAAFDTDTSVATSFDPDLGDSFQAGSSMVLAGSVVYISGDFTEVNGDTTRNRFASFDATTGEVTAFNPNVNDTINEIAVDGSVVYAGGYFSTVNGGTTRNRLAAFDATTGTVTSFDAGISEFDSVTSIALSEDGSLVYVGGNISMVNDDVERLGIAAFDTTTSLVTDFDPGFTGSNSGISEIAVDGTALYIGGSFSLSEYVERNGVAAVDATTGIATDFDPNVNGSVYSLLLSPDGETLYVGGTFGDVNGGTIRNGVAAVDVTTSIATDFDPDITGGRVSGMDFSSDGLTLYAVGELTTVNGDIPRAGFAEFDLATSNVTDFDPALNGGVAAADVADGVVYIGGSFTAAGASTRHNVAAIDLSSYTLLPFDPDINNTVNALALSSDGLTLYVGGTFICVNGIFDGEGGCLGTTRNRLAAFTTVDGVVTAFNPNMASTVNALKLSSDDSILYAGGSFQTVNGGTSRRRIAAFTTVDGVVTAFNPNMSSTVNSLELSADESVLYAGGAFTTVNNGAASRSRLASFTTADGAVTAFNPDVDGTVRALKLSLDESTVFAGGDFGDVNGGDATRNYLAEFTIADSIATAFAPNPDSTVRGLDLSSDGSTLYVGGDFTQIDGLDRLRIASVNSATGEVSDFSPSVDDIDSSVNTLILSPDQSELYAGGAFTGGLAIYTLIEDEIPSGDDDDDDDNGDSGGGSSSSHRGRGVAPASGGTSQDLLALLRSLITQFIAQGGTPSPAMLAFLGAPATTGGTYTRDLDINSEGSDVTALQLFLIAQNKGPQAQALAVVGATGLFGPLTQAALAEYQLSVGITPAAGYFGPVTRAHINGL